jgi:CheY-like chemotaxis protein
VQQLYLTESKQYSLILTDCSMPVMDGYKSSSLIREFYEQEGLTQPYIVACTGHTEEKYIKKAWNSKIDEVMSKPVSVKFLKALLEDISYVSEE